MPDLRVVEGHVDENEHQPEREIEREAPQKDLALDADDPRALDEPLEKQPAVDVGEEPPVHHSRHHGQSQQSKDVHARRGKEPVGPRRTLPRVAIDDAAGEERPAREIEAERAHDRKHLALAVEQAADVVQRGREADDGRRERRPDAGRL